MASLFVRPPMDAYDDYVGENYIGNYKTYAHYNYLRPGIISRLKANRFEVALRLVQDRFGRANAVDFGCADGVFLPSLSAHFANVAGVDASPVLFAQAQSLVTRLGLHNVTVLCNAGKDMRCIAELLPKAEGGFSVMFLLETLEHIGQVDRPYESRIEFVRSILSLLNDDGVLVISVPRMVGLLFLAKYLLQTATHTNSEPIPWRQVLRSSLLRNTDDLEPLWTGRHVGFNHLKLEKHLRSAFRIQAVRRTLTSIFYLIAKRAG